MKVLRSDYYNLVKSQTGNGKQSVYWDERLNRPTAIAEFLAKKSGRELCIIDCGYMLAPG